MRPRLVRVTDLLVAETLGLQGADMVATENYWHALEQLKLGAGALPRAHMRAYLANMFHEGLIMARAEIEELASSLGQPV
jgi:hypothetical protein